MNIQNNFDPQIRMSTALAAKDNDKGEDTCTLNKFPASEVVGDKVPEGETNKRSRRPIDKGKQLEIDKSIKCYAKYIRLLKRSFKDLNLEVTAGTETEGIRPR